MGLLGLDGIVDLPAVRWWQQSLGRLGAAERTALVAGLERALGQAVSK